MLSALLVGICILHVCGGDPYDFTEFINQLYVFSTYVEVIPENDYVEGVAICILHVCGGDPCGGQIKQ